MLEENINQSILGKVFLTVICFCSISSKLEAKNMLKNHQILIKE